MDARTKYPEIFAALAAEFPRGKVKNRPSGNGGTVDYITARTAMNRLDEVLGAENWEDEYYETCGVLFCRLTITLPGGEKVAKCGSGGFKEMTTKERGQTVKDEENTDKTGESDAFKRAAVKFGVARYLYKDGVPDYGRQSPPARQEAKAAPARDDQGRPQGPSGVVAWAEDMVRRANEWYAREHPDDEGALCENQWQLIRHLAKKAEFAGWIEIPPKSKVGTVARMLEGLDAKHRKLVEGIAREYLYSDLPADRAVGVASPSRGREPGQEG